MLSNGDYCKSNGMFQTPFVNQIADLCEEINRLIDENANLCAENKRLNDELDALNNALEDDGK